MRKVGRGMGLKVGAEMDLGLGLGVGGSLQGGGLKLYLRMGLA